MHRMSETDPDRTTPGHNAAKKRKASYTKEADNLHNCPLNLRINKNHLLCRNAKRSPEESANSQAPKGQEAAKGKKTVQDCGEAIKPHGRGKFPQGEERPSTSRQVNGEGESRNKENGFCTNRDISCASTSKGDSNPHKGKKRVGNTNPDHKNPGHSKGRGLQSVRTPTCPDVADFATAMAVQLSITLQTEQVKKATRATLNAMKFLTRTSEDKTRRQNKMSISLDEGMNTSMEMIDP